MKRLYFFIVIFLISTFSVCFAEQASNETSNIEKTSSVLKSEANKDYLTFSVELEKESFIINEPVNIKLTLTNNSDQPHRLAEPYLDWTANYKIFQLEGKEVIPIQPIATVMSPPKDFGWIFRPGENNEYYFDIHVNYIRGIPSGKYMLVAKYYVNEKKIICNDWFGSIITPPIEFIINEPSTEIEKEASRIYFDMMKRSRERKTLPSVIGMAAEIEKLGVIGNFNKGANRLELKAYSIQSDIDEYKLKLLSYIDNYGIYDSISYGSLYSLGMRFRNKNKYNEAKEIYEMMPEGYIRSRGIAECDKLIKESSKSEKTIY